MLHVFGLFTLGFFSTAGPVRPADWRPEHRKSARRGLIVLVAACTVALNPDRAAASPAWGALSLACV